MASVIRVQLEFRSDRGWQLIASDGDSDLISSLEIDVGSGLILDVLAAFASG
jgi:hypothetical protein